MVLKPLDQKFYLRVIILAAIIVGLALLWWSIKGPLLRPPGAPLPSWLPQFLS